MDRQRALPVENSLAGSFPDHMHNVRHIQRQSVRSKSLARVQAAGCHPEDERVFYLTDTVKQRFRAQHTLFFDLGLRTLPK